MVLALSVITYLSLLSLYSYKSVDDKINNINESPNIYCKHPYQNLHYTIDTHLKIATFSFVVTRLTITYIYPVVRSTYKHLNNVLYIYIVFFT